jgi:hypothetical protein
MYPSENIKKNAKKVKVKVKVHPRTYYEGREGKQRYRSTLF